MGWRNGVGQLSQRWPPPGQEANWESEGKAGIESRMEAVMVGGMNGWPKFQWLGRKMSFQTWHARSNLFYPLQRVWLVSHVQSAVVTPEVWAPHNWYIIGTSSLIIKSGHNAPYWGSLSRCLKSGLLLWKVTEGSWWPPSWICTYTQLFFSMKCAAGEVDKVPHTQFLFSAFNSQTFYINICHFF